MKVENIKAALKARANSLKLNPLENKPPVVVDDTVNPAHIVPVDAAITPTEEASKAHSDKPDRKPKKTPAPVVPADDINDIVAKYLKAGRDYDRLTNTNKPTLLKSGAEILAGVFGFRTTAKVINRVEDYDKQFVLYEVCVTVLDQDGNVVAEGLGSCNCRERRYLKTDFATNLNTVLKIAKKRAYVDAILSATHASKVFTQDIEDIINPQGVTDNRKNTSR